MGCNNEDQRRGPSVSVFFFYIILFFSFGDSASACYTEPRGLSETERSQRVCFALISDIVGQDVNCTSGQQFVRPASSVLFTGWCFPGGGVDKFIRQRFYVCKREQLSGCVLLFPAHFVGNTQPRSHTVAL